MKTPSPYLGSILCHWEERNSQRPRMRVANLIFKFLKSALVSLFLVLSIATATNSTAFDNQKLNTGCDRQVYPKGWVAKENAKKGDSHWEDLVSNSQKGTVSGWFDKTSVSCGDLVGLHLSGNNRPVTIKIYRMGYYNGTHARLVYVKSIGSVPTASPPSIASDATHLTSTSWPTSATIKIDASYPTGVYLARFDDGGKAGYTPLIVRSNTTTTGMLIVEADLTWEAYNTYGGWSLYHGPHAGVYSPGRMASFNRPYDRDGKSNFTIYDAGIVQTAETLGLDVSYTDDLAVNRNPSSVLNHTAIIYSGHTEYWTAMMLAAAYSARDHGVNLIFLGANSAYWRTRLESNDRTVVVWKGNVGDPYVNNPGMITNKWGENPTPFNQSQLLGALYGGILASPVFYVVQGANAWPIKGTGLKTGDVIAGVVGKEVETTDIGQGPPLESFLTSKVVSIDDPHTWTIGLTYYTTVSGAGVVDVGTMGWVCNITNTCSWKSTADAKTKVQVIAITKEILTAAAAGPLGISHPEVSNIPTRTVLEPICISECHKS